ncbi:Ubiquitin domain-containing protein ubfd1 [Borealophlyctis nickersoniae]|nr:Ubiquitin domain-containing protein ubfd1 [Borealophlyctis nickersoniae]
MMTSQESTPALPVEEPPQAGMKRKMDEIEGGPHVNFKLAHGKTVYDINLPSTTLVADLKKHVEELSGVHANMQKLLYKGMLKDEQTLEEAKVKDGVRVMLMASKVEDVLKVATAAASSVKDEKPAGAIAEKVSWSEMTEHKKVLEKGKPDDAEAAIPNKKLPIPARGVYGLLNGRGMKTRLTFKNDVDQVWIGTNERTQKIPYGSITSIKSEPIKGNENYHIMALQLGPTEKSNYYLYFVPCQYVESVKDAILGTFQSWF